MSEINSFLSRIGIVFHWVGFGFALIIILSVIVGIFDEGLEILTYLLFAPLPVLVGWVIRWLLVGGNVPYLPYQD